MRVFQSLDSFAQLWQSECGLRFAVRLVQEIHQLPDKTAEAVHKPFLLTFQCGNGLLFKPRHGILATSGNVSRLERAGKNPRLAAPVFPSRICQCTTSCSVL